MNKTNFVFLFYFWLLSAWGNTSHAVEPISTRKVENLNREWKYAKGDIKGGELPTFDDGDWENIGIPHSFSIPYFMSKDFYTGYGWYRKQVLLGKEDLSKELFLEFDGVFQETEVYVNGQKAGCHVGGYTGFSIGISSLAKEGDNQIAVRVNNIWHPDIAPRAGEHVFSGGIYRNVRLVKKGKAYIDWYGTFVTTPDLSKTNGASSSVHIQTTVCNRSKAVKDYKLKSEIIDKNGKVVSAVTTTKEILPGENTDFLQQTDRILQPSLWSVTHPELYKVRTTLYDGKKVIDIDETSFGFRWVEWTTDKGFFINGEHLYLKGANVHQDHAGWGDAVTEAGMRRDICLMKEAGFNFIRGSHYPHSPAFSRICDEEGMLLWSENAFWGIGGFQSEGYWNSSAYPVNEKDRAGFDTNIKMQLTEMIRIHRNHPSVFIWSMSNEPFFTASETTAGMTNLLREMITLSHQSDPTRRAAIGGAQRPLGKDRIDNIGDVAGYNGDGSSIPEFQNPGFPTVVSEYGSTTADRPGEYVPGWGDHDPMEKPWRSGQAIWCGFDHGSIAGSQLGKMGIVDYFRIPKRAWYWYRNEYRQIPPPVWPKNGVPACLKLEADKTRKVATDGTDDVMLLISVLDANGKEISNSPEVKLTVVSGPGEFPTGRSIQFEETSDIRIADGKAAIEFRSYYAGISVIRATSPGIEPAEVTIHFEGEVSYDKRKNPETNERPYVRFVREQTLPAVQTFGRNNPTFASTNAQTHTAGMAGDGDETTWWEAAAGDQSPFWILDTEKGLMFHTIRIIFPQPEAYQYKIEVSDDKDNWSLLKDNSTNVKREKMCELVLKENKASGRFVRVSFTADKPSASIAEVIVTGVVRK